LLAFFFLQAFGDGTIIVGNVASHNNNMYGTLQAWLGRGWDK